MSDHKNIKPAEDESIDALILLCRALLAKPEHNAAKLAGMVKITKDQFNGFFNHKTMSPTVKSRYSDIAGALRNEFEKSKFLTGPKRNLMSFVYDDLPDMEIEGISLQGGKSIVKTYEIQTQKSPYLDNAEVRNQQLPTLFGLNAVVRMANDFIPIEGDNERQERGWSLSIMNIIPEYIQKGTYHPLYKIRQFGTSGSEDIEIEGQIISQDDRFIFSGVEIQQKRPVIMSFSHSGEKMRGYANPEKTDNNSENIHLSGLLFGVSNSRKQFSSHIKMFQIRDALLFENDAENKQKQEEFLARYKRARQLAGIMNAQDLVENLSKLGIIINEASLNEWKKLADQQRVLLPI